MSAAGKQMNTIITPRNKATNRAVPAFIAGLSLLTMLAVSLIPGARNVVSGGVRPILSGSRQGVNWAMEGVRGMIPLSAMERRRLESLQEEVYRLRTELTVAEQVKEENKQLRQQLELAPMAGWERLTALVIARDPISWNRRFRINRGAKHGVIEGNLVLRGDQAVGRVIEAGETSSMVAVLSNPECRLSVRLREHEVTGVMMGLDPAENRSTRRPMARIDYLPVDVDYESGDIVETSGLSGLAPGGIEVGRLLADDRRRQSEPEELPFARLNMEPVAELSNLRVVTVLSGGE